MLPIFFEPSVRDRSPRVIPKVIQTAAHPVGAVLSALLVVGFCGAVVRHVGAQVLQVAVETTDENANVARPFTLPTQKSEVNDDLADFARHTKKAAWDRAFKSLQKVLDANPQGLMPRADGLMVPSQHLIRKSITDLPPEGRDAFRVFHDPEAKKLVEESQALPAGSPEELAKLEKVYHSYFITSSGDRAADRLGDIFFEQSNHSQALDCWRSILQHHSESSLPRAQLLVKSALAAARLGRWDDVRDFQKQIAERHAADQVQVAGKSVSAADFVNELLTKSGEAPIAIAETPLPPDMPPPPSKEPTWQFRMLSQTDAAMLASAGRNWGWGVTFAVSEMVPVAVADANRVYVNFFGHHFAVDLKTGKLVWRSVRFHDVAQKVQNNFQMSQVEQYGMTLAGEHLYTVYRDPAQLGQQTPFRLAKLEAATGKEVWSTANIPDVQTWSMMGVPVVVGDRVLLGVINPQQATEQRIVAINAADGKLIWNTHIGTHQMDPNQLYGRRSSQPAIVVYREKAYVETHAGALVALDARTGAIDWAFQYESEMLQNNFWWGGNEGAAKLTTASTPLVANGVLYFKGMRSKRLIAIDLSGPSVLWQRPINQPAMIVGADEKFLYLSGDGLMAIDLKSKALKWSNQINPQSSFSRAFVTENRLMQFTGRGIYEIDAETGDQKSLFRGGDLDSYGGNIIAAKDALVTVSNLSISAYRFQADAAAPAANATTGAAPASAEATAPAGGGEASPAKAESPAETKKAP